MLPNDRRHVETLTSVPAAIATFAGVLVERSRVRCVIRAIVFVHHLVRGERLVGVEHVTSDSRGWVRGWVHGRRLRAGAGCVHVVEQMSRLFVGRVQHLLRLCGCWANRQDDQGHCRDGDKELHPKHSVVRLFFRFDVGLHPKFAVGCKIDSEFDGRESDHFTDDPNDPAEPRSCNRYLRKKPTVTKSGPLLEFAQTGWFTSFEPSRFSHYGGSLWPKIALRRENQNRQPKGLRQSSNGTRARTKSNRSRSGGPHKVATSTTRCP